MSDTIQQLNNLIVTGMIPTSSEDMASKPIYTTAYALQAGPAPETHHTLTKTMNTTYSEETKAHDRIRKLLRYGSLRVKLKVRELMKTNPPTAVLEALKNSH